MTGLRMTTAGAASSLADALPREMTRVRDEILPLYVELGPVGGFGSRLMRQALDEAAATLASGDVVRMLHAYEALKGWEQ